MVKILKNCVLAGLLCFAPAAFMPNQPLPGEAPEGVLAVPPPLPGMPPRGGTEGAGMPLRRNNAVIPGGAVPAVVDEELVPGGG